jgi:hypothetical protein
VSPALYEFVTNITNGVKDTIAPLSEQTASLAAEKIRALPMSMQMPAASYRDRVS